MPPMVTGAPYMLNVVDGIVAALRQMNHQAILADPLRVDAATAATSRWVVQSVLVRFR